MGRTFVVGIFEHLSNWLNLAFVAMQIAKRQAVVNPENTFFSVKRFIGRRMAEVKGESMQVPYQVRSWVHMMQDCFACTCHACTLQAVSSMANHDAVPVHHAVALS